MVLPSADGGADINEENKMGLKIEFGNMTADETSALVVKAMDELADNDVIDIIVEWATGDDIVREELIAQLEAV